MNILGISAYYHDSAACLLQNGEIIAAAQEERFTRLKHDSRFPINAVKFCLDFSSLSIDQIDSVVFYEKPFVKFERLLKTYLAFAPTGVGSFCRAMPAWIKEKLFMKSEIAKALQQEFKGLPKELLFYEHHRSHAASAFFPSPFKEAAVLCLDGVGEWATTSAWIGKDNALEGLWEIRFPHSLGLLYSAFTQYLGFKVNSGEYKLMGLAPYGEPEYRDLIIDKLIDIKPDGSFRLDMSYFNYCTGLSMINKKFCDLFGGPAVKPESTPTQREMNLASSIQTVTEEIVLKLAETLHQTTGSKNLCLAGGVALNCVANGRLLREGPFENIWIQPAAGDAGGACGCALGSWYEHYENERIVNFPDSMKNCYLGPQYSESEIESFLNEYKIQHTRLSDDELFARVAQDIDSEKVVGWFSGRMEYGPRALGNRSILGDARSDKMQKIMNLKIKFRESFRPFAPTVLEESVSDYFETDVASPYMLLTADVKKSLLEKTDANLKGLELLNSRRSNITAVTHVDNSARIQTVSKNGNPRYYRLIKEFQKRTGCGVIVNTSFNVRGEPIVCSFVDAYKCFMRTEMDCLILENFYLVKEQQGNEPIERLGLENFKPD